MQFDPALTVTLMVRDVALVVYAWLVRGD